MLKSRYSPLQEDRKEGGDLDVSCVGDEHATGLRDLIRGLVLNKGLALHMGLYNVT
jgi:hypothetical protein